MSCVAPAGAKSASKARSAKKGPKGRTMPKVAARMSKSGRIFELLARASGATLAELMMATGWQAHSCELIDVEGVDRA